MISSNSNVQKSNVQKSEPNNSNHFENLRERIQKDFDKYSKEYVNIFTTDVENLWDAFLTNLPIEKLKYYTCNACKKFIESYGGLVCIKKDGTQFSPLWEDVTRNDFGYLSESIKAVFKQVSKAEVNGIFLSSEKRFGLPVTGFWTHIYSFNNFVFNHPLLTAFQKSAEKLEDFGILQRGLNDFPNEIVKQALTILKTDVLYRSEKVIGVANWLNELQTTLSETTNKKAKHNLIWLAVANAPPGFCHIRSTMIGTLLSDIAEGLPLEEVKKKFSSKMNPLQYQRPTASPAAGNIVEAEKIIAKLSAEGALARRFARLEDIKFHWEPKEQKQKRESQNKIESTPGVFSHLIPKNSTPQVAGFGKNISSEIPPQVITWEKFNRTVLPTAAKIEYYVENKKVSYLALVTAYNSDSQPILQWDTESQRNSVSWYVYASGSLPASWNLKAYQYTAVTGITYIPPMWHNPEKFKHHGERVIFLLEGCKDSKGETAGLGLFPENMKNEYHGIRSTIEAFSRKGKILQYDQGNANGVCFYKNGGIKGMFKVRVTDFSGIQLCYSIDRWD